tara:strand:+ start:68 stop:409 length:342 start_codon:yes stop_codon:yes gene_type:complete
MFFKKKPNEEQIETTALWAAESIYKESLNYKEAIPESVKKAVIKDLYSAQELKPDSRQSHATYVTVLALVSEAEMIKELCEFRKQNPGSPIPSDYSRRMKEIAIDFAKFAMNH